MAILIGCEYSGLTRNAFIAAGFDAISCDLRPTERPGPHIQGDVLEAVKSRKWELIILHPDCTYMAVSGNRWYAGTQKRKDAEQWTKGLWLTSIRRCPHVALENPTSSLASVLGPATHSIQPWQFGHGEKKRICWWLHNLPPLEPTDVVDGRDERVWRMGPSADRGKERSRWYEGIARAEADQWGRRLMFI